MSKPVILCEDSSGGLYLWALLNRFVFDEFFDLKFANENFINCNVTLSDFSDRKSLRFPGSNGTPSAGYNLIPNCLRSFNQGDRVILAYDLACSGAPLAIQPAVHEAQLRGVKIGVLGYNCAMDILLSFADLCSWHHRCLKYERNMHSAHYIDDVNSGLDYDELLYRLSRTLRSGKIGRAIISEIPELLVFQRNHAINCVEESTQKLMRSGYQPGVADFSIEHTLDFFLSLYTENSRLATTKKRLSDCFCFDCGFLNRYCPIRDDLGQKLIEIYEGSTLYGLMQHAASVLGIQLPTPCGGSRPREYQKVDTNQNGLDSDNRDLTEFFI